MDLRPPPAHTHKQKSPVAEEFRALAFESMADELEHPSDQEQNKRVEPQPMEKDAGHKNREREQNGRDAQRVAQPVHRMPMAGAILRDPLLVGASAQHAGMISREEDADETENVAVATAGRPCAYNIPMYHYNPSTALEELNEEATLPNPVHVRDMMLRRKLSADEALELNRIFLEYQKFFGETQKLGKDILRRLAA